MRELLLEKKIKEAKRKAKRKLRKAKRAYGLLEMAEEYLMEGDGTSFLDALKEFITHPIEFAAFHEVVQIAGGAEKKLLKKALKDNVIEKTVNKAADVIEITIKDENKAKELVEEVAKKIEEKASNIKKHIYIKAGTSVIIAIGLFIGLVYLAARIRGVSMIKFLKSKMGIAGIIALIIVLGLIAGFTYLKIKGSGMISDALNGVVQDLRNHSDNAVSIFKQIAEAVWGKTVQVKNYYY